MKLIQRLRTLIQAAVYDVIGEDAEPEEQASPDGPAVRRLAEMLTEAQADLDALRLELAKAAEREKRITQARQEAENKAKSADEAVDAALRSGDDALAADYLKQAKQARAIFEESDELRQACQKLTGQIRSAVETRQERLNQLRSRYQALTDRARTTEALESLLQAQREMAQQTETLREELRTREEQITHREDRLAARQEWNQ